MSEEREGFLSRWSRKKRLETGVSKVDAPSVDMPAAADPELEEAEFDISTLPALDSLTETSDALAFLQKGVPDHLKNAALRRIWSADVSIRDYIGPVEMGWDFNDPNGIPGFGPLSPEADVAALLRQAIGEVEPVIEAEQPDAPQVALVEGSDDVPARETTDEDLKTELAGIEAIPAQPVSVKNADLDGVALEESSSFRALRRHGGALPSS